MPVLTASYQGFVNGDTPAVVVGLVLSTSASAASNVGSYAINASSATAADYKITFVAGSVVFLVSVYLFIFRLLGSHINC